MLVNKQEHDKAQLQLDRRTLRAPLDGVIVKAHKQEGEFVAAHDPLLFAIVQLDPLLAVFSVPSHQAVALQAGQKVVVGINGSDDRPQGTIDFVSPVTDAESGTVRINVRLQNGNRLYRSGERCTLYFP